MDDFTKAMLQQNLRNQNALVDQVLDARAEADQLRAERDFLIGRLELAVSRDPLVEQVHGPKAMDAAREAVAGVLRTFRLVRQKGGQANGVRRV